MDIRRLCKGAVAAARIRDQLQRTGMTWSGQPLWTDEEIATLRELYPSYTCILQALTRRTYSAVTSKARSLGLTPKRHVWTEIEKVRFRKLYRVGGVSDALRHAFPGTTDGNLRSIAHYYQYRRDPRPPKLSGLPLIDAIRRRAFDLGYTMVELDIMADTRGFFQGWNWTARSENHRSVGRAVKALGGQFKAVWLEDRL